MRRVSASARGVPALLAVAATLLSLALSACGDEDAPVPQDEAATPAATAQEQLTVTHLLVTFKDAPTQVKTERTKEKAKELAAELIAEVQAGANFDELVTKWTADVDRDKKPNTNNGKPGSYTWPTPTIPHMVAEFEKAARALKVGTVTPEPVATDFGYHIIRRDELIPPTK